MSDDQRDGELDTTHAPWTKIVTVVVLLAFVLALLVGALLV